LQVASMHAASCCTCRSCAARQQSSCDADAFHLPSTCAPPSTSYSLTAEWLNVVITLTSLVPMDTHTESNRHAPLAVSACRTKCVVHPCPGPDTLTH
jgi:hypothetical protein